MSLRLLVTIETSCKDIDDCHQALQDLASNMPPGFRGHSFSAISEA